MQSYIIRQNVPGGRDSLSLHVFSGTLGLAVEGGRWTGGGEGEEEFSGKLRLAVDGERGRGNGEGEEWGLG